MKRRTILRRSSVLGAAALAGCLSEAAPESNDSPDESDPGDADPEEDADTEDSDGISVAAVDVETVASDCASGEEDPTAAVRLDESETAVAFEGVLDAGSPCHEVVVDSAQYDETDDVLGIVLATERGDGVCTDCVAALEYEGSVEFDGGLPGEAAVSYQDVVLGSTSDGDESGDSESDGDESSDGSPELADSAIDVTEVSPGEEIDDADIEFDRDSNAVVVEGTIRGSDACQTAALGGVDYDEENDALSVDVVTTAADDADDRMCAETIVEIDYAVRAEFEGGLPSSAAVSHDGHAFVSAGHGSSSASASGSASESTSTER